jgi:hypothetical protein
VIDQFNFWNDLEQSFFDIFQEYRNKIYFFKIELIEIKIKLDFSPLKLQDMKRIFILFLFIFHDAISFECGVKKVKYSGAFIHNGATAYRGEWPWLAALFTQRTNQYFCSASLVNEFTLITGKILLNTISIKHQKDKS